MAYCFRQDLFEVKGKALCFDVATCHDAADLESIIEFGGGRTDKRGGKYTITFETRNSQRNSHFDPPRDVYCSDFILKCCIMNTILPLKNFLLKESMFTSVFDPNDILLQRMSWNDAQNLFVRPIIAEGETFRSPPGSLIINGKVPVVKLETMEDTENYNQRFYRHEFTQNDRQKIVDHIISNPNFNISSQYHWRQMAKEFSVHTWESLKSHFRNKIYPSLSQYNLSDELMENIRTQMNSKKRVTGTKKKINKTKSDSEDSDVFPPLAKKAPKLIIASDDESSDVSLKDLNKPLCNKERDKKLDKNGTCQPDKLLANDKQDLNESSMQSSVSFSKFMISTPPQKEKHGTENFTGMPEDLSDHFNSDQEEGSVQNCKSPTSLSQGEEHATEVKSKQNISVQCDCDEATVTDSFVQTEPVEVLPLPVGWDEPTTFAAAIELMRSIETMSKDDVQGESEQIQKPSSIIHETAVEEVNDPLSRRTKLSLSKAESLRRRKSPRMFAVPPKKTRSGWLF